MEHGAVPVTWLVSQGVRILMQAGWLETLRSPPCCQPATRGVRWGQDHPVGHAGGGGGGESLPRLCPKSHEMLREDFEQGAGRDWLHCGLLWPLHGFSRPPMRWLLLHSFGLDSKGKYKMKGSPTQTREKKPAPHHGTTRAEQVVSRCSSVSP